MQVAADIALHPGIELAALGGAVLAPAVGAKPGGVDGGAPAARRRARAQLGARLPHAVGAARRGERGRGLGGVVLAEYLHHAAGGVAVELGQRPAQHLDAAGRREGDARGLGLAIGHGGRDAVDDHAHAADAEGRAGAEAADRELQVLRVVLPVEDADARHAAQRLREVDLGAGALDGRSSHRVDGRRVCRRRSRGCAGRKPRPARGPPMGHLPRRLAGMAVAPRSARRREGSGVGFHRAAESILRALASTAPARPLKPPRR